MKENNGNYKIDDNLYTRLEDGIRDVVFALNQKKYLTISSCEGHAGHNANSKHVTLFFPTIRCRESFLSMEFPKFLMARSDIGFQKMYPLETELPEGTYKIRGEHKCSLVESNNNEWGKMFFGIDSLEWCAAVVFEKVKASNDAWLKWVDSLPVYKHSIELNQKNPDGSVNAWYAKKSRGFGYHVPYGVDEFCSQIEEGILASVMFLNRRGYRTYTSCHGHSKKDFDAGKSINYNSGPQITIHFDTEEAMEKFKDRLKQSRLTVGENPTLVGNFVKITYESDNNEEACRIIESELKEFL